MCFESDLCSNTVTSQCQMSSNHRVSHSSFIPNPPSAAKQVSVSWMVGSAIVMPSETLSDVMSRLRAVGLTEHGGLT